MTIEVKGNNNRVAGRDFYENQTRPCPSCEIRLVEQHKDMCRHCLNEKRQKEAKEQMTLAILGALFVSAFYMKWKQTPGVPVDIALLGESFLVGAATVVVVIALFRTLILKLKD